MEKGDISRTACFWVNELWNPKRSISVKKRISWFQELLYIQVLKIIVTSIFPLENGLKMLQCWIKVGDYIRQISEKRTFSRRADKKNENCRFFTKISLPILFGYWTSQVGFTSYELQNSSSTPIFRRFLIFSDFPFLNKPCSRGCFQQNFNRNSP